MIGRLAAGLGHDAEALLARSGADDVKAALRAATARAEQLGIYGAPSFVTADGELFWGSDRLADALAWAKGQRWGLPA